MKALALSLVLLSQATLTSFFSDGPHVTFELPLLRKVQLTPDFDILTRPGAVPLMQRWWFWAIVSVAAAGLFAGGYAITTSDRYTPQGELGASRTRDWDRP